MSESMGDLLYERKFNEMQMYIPFLTRVIDKLKNNEQDKPRKAQLEKMKMLHGLLTNNQKKLKIDTLLKCESVLKKLHAKIEKSDEVSPPKVNKAPSTTTEIPSQFPSSVRSPRHVSSPLDKHLSKGGGGSTDVNTCPASPTQFGDVDFRPPVEIPTERRCSPLRTGGHWDRHTSNRSPVDSSRIKINSTSTNNKPRPPDERQRSTGNRWCSTMSSSSSSSLHHNNSWPSSTSSSSSVPSGHRRSCAPQRYDSQQKESSEEENWDDPEDEMPPQPPVLQMSRSPPSSVLTSLPPSHRFKYREQPHGSHYIDQHQHQHRHHEKPNKQIHDQSFNPMSDISLEQKKLFHDTIFKYRKPDPPAPQFNPFSNPQPPEPRITSPPSTSTIFHRLGDKVESGYENFRIQVKNDKMKQKASKPAPLPSLQLPPALPIKPIDEVLKSPPLSADDIDDLLNESLEAAQEKGKQNTADTSKDSKTSALELVRKKLAMISKVPPTGHESPTSKDMDQKEPFYRRGHTPTKKAIEPFRPDLQGNTDSFNTPSTAALHFPEASPQSPPNSMSDNVIERLALKYHPHRRRDSIPQSEIHSSPVRDLHVPEPSVVPAERLALKYHPHPRREPPPGPQRNTDPRMGKSMVHGAPLIVPPNVSAAPVANVLPTINSFDPRLRNSRLANVEPIPSAQFCPPLPPPQQPQHHHQQQQQYPQVIPSLLELKVPNPLVGPNTTKPHFGMPPNRIDPRTQKPPSTVYAEKFNPERNDQTERMKYLESKKKKPPEPKTYGEYRQSKCRMAAESAAKPVEAEEHMSAMSTNSPSAPSTLDKMYRTMEYGKEIGKGIQGFKIPKKPKPVEEIKSEPKIEESSQQAEEQSKKEEESEKKDEKPSKTEEKQPLKKDAKKDEKSAKKDDKVIKKDEKQDKSENKTSTTVKSLKDVSTEQTENVLQVSEKVEEVKNAKEPEQSSKTAPETLSVSKIKYEPLAANHDDTGECLNESQPDDALVIDENGEAFDASATEPRRTRGRPKTKKQEQLKEEPIESPIEKPTEEATEEDELDVKSHRLRSKRSTLLKDDDDDAKVDEAPSPASSTPVRSASEIFSPSTDNSIVSTQNIITGKRRTRASINFNEKGVKKNSTPAKATPASSPAAAKIGTAKPAAKTMAKKAPASAPAPAAARKTRSKSIGKRVSDSGQICAVSSTTSQSGDAEESHEDLIAVDDASTHEEPTSSGSKPQTPVVDADENQKKQEWLEGFLKSIVDPSTNKDGILQMLKAVLDEKKLQQVKDILYSPDETPEAGDATANNKKQETNSKAKPKKKNELDRLNEDIRDMFICQGVMTATGRRMCTLAKEESKEKSAAKKSTEPQKKAKEPQKESPKQSPSTAPSVLSPSEHKKHIRRAKVTIKPINLRALRSRAQKTESPAREMPILEPNTPIKLPEEKEIDEVESEQEVEVPKTVRKRPVPKSKRSPETLVLDSDDDDDDMELVHLKKKIRKMEEKMAAKLKADEVTEIKDDVEDVEEIKEVEEISPPKTTKSEEISEKAKPETKELKVAPFDDVFIKNVNPDWHTMSDYASCCVICKEKARFIAPHYLTAHNNSEIYTSRLPPSVLADIKQGIGNRALYAISKKPNLNAFHYRCPFCDFQATNTLRGWMEHFTIHTGEYQYKCSACFKAMNGCTHLLEHIKKYCPEAKKINREPINLRGHTISGYVCHLCNFIQMLHSGVVKHLEIHHGLTDSKSIANIIKVQLIESAGVPKMEEKPEVKQVVPEQNLPPPPAPPVPIVSVKEKENPIPKESNMEVFLSRELASPTSDVLTERLKSIDQDEGITSDSSVNTNSQFSDGPPPVPRMTIAERLSQRFKNIEKQNNLLEEVRAEETPASVEEPRAVEAPQDTSNVIQMDMEPPASEQTPSVIIDTLQASTASSQSIEPASFNESGNLVIDEEAGEKSTVDDSGSEDADGNDDDNWEDIEITETKGTSSKDKNKNNSIFQTLSRLYASIAPKKGVKRLKEKRKTSHLETTEKNQEPSTAEPSLPVSAPSPTPVSEPSFVAESGTSQEPTPTQSANSLPPQISNLSDLLPDSPSDSLDMLLETNFNCLEGDGTSFPHLDLNDLESPIFLMPEDQTNLQDAIAMATDMDQTKYDDMNDPLPAIETQSAVAVAPPKRMTSTSVQRIGNLGFSQSADSVKYYCMVAACTFLFSDHPDGLQNHFLLEHPSLKWNGYCNTCQAQVSADGGREMQHMLEAHSGAKPVESLVEKPRIKFRRLTGDILSTDKALPTDASIPPESLKEKELPPEPPQLSLTSLLQSAPRPMIPPTPPVGFEADIPLYKNVSKEFTITGVAEAVTDDDLRNLVINQPTTPGGLQISQVVSLNAGSKSLTSPPTSDPALTSAPTTSSVVNPTYEHPTSNALTDFRALLQLPSVIPQPRNSPAPAATSAVPLSVHSSTPPPCSAPKKQVSFKCCAKNCSFSSLLRSAMHDHIEFHVRTDKDRGAFKCHECSFEALHTIDYFRHMEQGHNTLTPPPSTNELTQKIQDILRSSSSGSSQVQDESEKDSLALEPSHDSLPDRIREAAEEMTSETGLSDAEVWKCPVEPSCNKPLSEKDFQSHITRHFTGLDSTVPSGSALKCPHCTLSYHRPAVLRAHMKTHSRHRYFCYVCCNTFFNYQQAQRHFSDAHTRTSHVQVQTLLPEDHTTRPFLVFNSEKLTALEVVQFGEKLLVEWERKKASTKTHFQPHEQYLLPLQPIFNNQVYCSVCNYKTKVRTNMFRHLQLHIQEVDVGSVDPVNPVPCLEKNEKHFDKMLNLACSSNTNSASKPKDAAGTVKVPAFVPDKRRFVCGHPGCTYLTINDNMLRSHLNALHSGEKGYQCPHCQEDICKKTMCAERIIQHLRFHGPKIYQCGECEYLHYTKHVVERHIHEKHSTVPSTNMVTLDRSETDVNKSTQVIMGKNASVVQTSSQETEAPEAASTSAAQGNKCKWECALCKFQTVTWNQMISHVNAVHHARHQYHCVHCTFGSAHLAHIMEHIDAKHPSKTREAKYLFYKINETPQDKAADTRPLWTRNDPKRVRSIRGILMENEEDAERTKQILSKSGVDLDDEDDDVEFVQLIEPETAVHPGLLGCFHCDFKTEEIIFLANHWKSAHWHLKNGVLVPKVPFFFRIHSILKCPLCSFVGDHVSLRIHAAATKHAQRSFCAADPKLPNTCGHCPFVFSPKRLELLARHYHREHRPSDVKNLSSSLLKHMLALGECQVYMQCYFCAEICADKAAIIEHEKDRHGSSNFRYKQIKDEVIYRCGMCHYSSTNEMATLRHMVDHFGGFSSCHFCTKPQESFNAYMQHCYAVHSKDLKKFKEIYTLGELTTLLGQMLLIFPNGLILTKSNLVHTQYGSTERIVAMYDEICKKALEPPIPPLCMARLIAKRSFEASEGKSLLPPPSSTGSAKKIAKRRSTVAMGIGDRDVDSGVPSASAKQRKRKSSISSDDRLTAEPLFSTVTLDNQPTAAKTETNPVAEEKKEEVLGFSFYGKKPEPLDLSKIYTHIAIADKYAPVSVKKFSLLFKINTKVVVEKMDFAQQSKKRSRLTCKPCPASKKWKHL